MPNKTASSFVEKRTELFSGVDRFWPGLDNARQRHTRPALFPNLPPMIDSRDDYAVAELPNDTDVAAGDDTLLMNSPLIEQLSDPHIGNWNRLVSQTNWEKGAVILRWRAAMSEAELPRAAFSDEAWAKRVGSVTSQHVGRLRRVAERFGEKEAAYPKLFWSHFQAALDWDDAELWLEGAVQNAWSVAQMRIQRWEAVGAPEELKPRAEDIFIAELDEDVNPRIDSHARSADRVEARQAAIGSADIDVDAVEGFDPDAAPPFDADDDKPKKEAKKSRPRAENLDGRKTGEILAQLSNFSDIPADMADAMEMLKVAILNHKLSGWKEVSPKTAASCLEAMKALISSVEE